MYNRDKWIEIDVDAIQNNLEEVKALLDSKTRLIAVVKANAYGHGAVDTARILRRNGVDFFAVSYLEEALQLRKAGIESQIMVFSPLFDEVQVAEAILNDITLSVASPRDGELVEQVCTRLNKPATVHLKVETGLGRFGFNPQQIEEACCSLNNNSNIYIEGIYTHMARATVNQSYTERQFSRFKNVLEQLKSQGYDIPLKHCANSGVFLKYPHMHLDAVRIGTLLSGQYPVGDLPHPAKLVDPYKFKTRVISIKTLEKGSYLGYYSTFRLKKSAQVAVIPVGFQDGLALEVGNRPAGWWDLIKIMAKMVLRYCNVSRFGLGVKINNQLYPIRGKVFMQMALVEIPLDVDIKVGDEVEVPIRKTLASQDIDRVYVKAGKAGKIGQKGRTTYVVEEV